MKKVTRSDIIRLSIEGGLFLTLLYFIWLKFYSVTIYSYPHEFREMNMVVIAKKFSQGINPYSYQSLNYNEIPEVTNVYGFLAPLLISPWIWIFNGKFSALQICQILTLVVEVMGIVLFYACTYRRTKDGLLSLLGAVVFFSCYWRLTASGGAFPDQWGMVLSLVLTYVFIIDEEKGEYRPALYVVLILCMFYIKQYFIFAVFGVFVALLKKSKKAARQYIAFGMVLGIISASIVQFLMPLYFVESIPLSQGTTTSNAIRYSIDQLIKLGFDKYAIFTYMILLSMITWGMDRNVTNWKSVVDLGKKGFEKLPYETIQFIFVLVPTVYIAQNRGTYFTYYLQIWIPYLIMTGCIAAHYLLGKVFVNTSRLMVPILFLIAVISYESIQPIVPFIKSKILTSEESERWEKAYFLLDQYSKEGEILVSPHLADYCLRHDIRTSDYGQAEFNNIENMKFFKSKRLWTKLFPCTEMILNKNIEYYSIVDRKIKNTEYACIALTTMGRYWLDEEMILEAGYELECEMTLVTGEQNWVTRFYVIR